MPRRDRFIGTRATGAREERRSPGWFGSAICGCAFAVAVAGAVVIVGAGVGATVGVGDDTYGVGKRERPGPRSGAVACAGLGATTVVDD